jgi:organic radical activating enzyme
MKLDRVEFYITNVCNLNCSNCNRYNNFAFSGHQIWNDYADIYKQWSKIIEFNEIAILGGEPLLNPDFMSWLDGINKLWPQSRITIITNGTSLDRHKELYDYLKNFKEKIQVSIGCHGYNQKKLVDKALLDWLKPPINKFLSARILDDFINCYNKIKDESWNSCNTLEDFYQLPQYIQNECLYVHGLDLDGFSANLIDNNGVRVSTMLANSFHVAALKFDCTSQKLSLHDSDPKKAINVCTFKMCPHFIKGKLYKCGPVGILPEFIKQFTVELPESDRDLLLSYQPAEVTWNTEKLESFLANQKNADSIPQCKFCPETLEYSSFEAGTKKVKITKLQRNTVT